MHREDAERGFKFQVAQSKSSRESRSDGEGPFAYAPQVWNVNNSVTTDDSPVQKAPAAATFFATDGPVE